MAAPLRPPTYCSRGVRTNTVSGCARKVDKREPRWNVGDSRALAVGTVGTVGLLSELSDDCRTSVGLSAVGLSDLLSDHCRTTVGPVGLLPDGGTFVHCRTLSDTVGHCRTLSDCRRCFEAMPDFQGVSMDEIEQAHTNISGCHKAVGSLDPSTSL